MGSSGWSAAEDAASASASGRIPRRSRSVAQVTVSVVVLVVVLVGVLLLGPVSPRISPPDWLLPVRIALLAAAVVLLILGPMRAWNRGEDTSTVNRILAVLTRAERRSAWRQLAGTEPVADEHRDVLIAGALEQWRGRAARRYSALGFVLLVGSFVLGASSLGYLIVAGAALLGMIVGFAVSIRRDAIAHRFLTGVGVPA